MTTTKTHPDFLRTLSARQIAWCEANGIAAAEQTRWAMVGPRRGKKTYQPVPVGWGFYFSKGERFILPVAANAEGVYLMERDDSEDGDGERQVARFDSLREALKALAAA